MSNNLAVIPNDNVTVIWDDSQSLKEIKEIFCPLLTESEFKAFIGLGKGTGLNPFLREIDAIKYDKSKPATFVIRRDGYRKSAQRNSDYDYHRVAAIYSEDEYINDNGIINHKYKFAGRGQLLGAYCAVKRRNSSDVIYVEVLLSEYDKKQSCWSTMKETMIKKTAESQALRMAFQELFANSLSEEEYETMNLNEPKQKKSEGLLDRIKSSKCNTLEGEVVEQETGESAASDQLEEIHALLAVKVFGAERLKGALEHYNAETLAQLTSAQANDFINILNKCPDKE